MTRIDSISRATLLFAASSLGAAIFLAAGTASAGASTDFDLDGFDDNADNCSETFNPGQDDTDGDECGNACDADYDQNGITGVSDFGLFGANFNTGNQLFCHVEPIPGCVVGVDDVGIYGSRFNTVPGPSGTTPGTVACP